MIPRRAPAFRAARGLRPRLRAWALAVLLAALLANCTAAPQVGIREWPAYRGFLVPRPLLPIEASGSVLFEYRGDRQSGNVLAQGTAAGQFQLRLTSPVLGTTALEVRFDARELLVVDLGAESYFLGANSTEHRLKLFSLDLTPEEFLMLLTARVPEPEFARGGGRIEGNAAEFRAGPVTYRFALDESGLPAEWRKEVEGLPAWRVEYREYQDVPLGEGTLRLPRKVRVYAGDPQPRLVLGIGAFRLWQADPTLAAFSFAPPPGMRFQGIGEGPTDHSR